MRKLLSVLLCFIFIFVTGCGNNREFELPKNVKAISAKWQDDVLLYATSNGISTYSPADGETKE